VGQPAAGRFVERPTVGLARFDLPDQNTNFTPTCSSRIGFLVVVIEP
jgi:hypothetical protein